MEKIENMKTQKEMQALGFEVEKYKGGYELLKYIGDDKDVVIPEGVVKIGAFAFEGKGLTSVKFPNSLSFIDWGAFASNNLKELSLKNVDEICKLVFVNNKLKSVDLNNVKYIGHEAFAYNNITKIDLKNVNFIEYRAFNHNPLKEFTHKGKTYKVDEANRTLFKKLGFFIKL